MFADIELLSHKSQHLPCRFPYGAFLSLGIYLSIFVPACSSDSASPTDGAVDSVQNMGGMAGRVGTGGAAGSLSNPDSAAEAGGADSDSAGTGCTDLPCLGTTASLIATCKTSNTCTYQTTSKGINRCFDNGVKTSVTAIAASASSPGGQMVMAVKKDGVPCYTFNVSYADTSGTAGIFVYQDAVGAPLITESVDSSGSTVTCPGEAAILTPKNTSCSTALAALGGLMPASSCLSGTAGTCQF
jgi:hypothetical protein